MLNSTYCPLHHQTVNRICGLPQCSQIMCHACFIQHEKDNGHDTAVVINSSSLEFFTDFLGYLDQKMKEWSERINYQGFEAAFVLQRRPESELPSSSTMQQMTKIVVKILRNYGQLMRNNRDFILAHQNNQQQFLNSQFFKDFYNAIVSKWDQAANALSTDIKQKIAEAFPYRSLYAKSKFNLKETLVLQVQTYREQLLKKIPFGYVLHYQNGVIVVRQETERVDEVRNEEEKEKTMTLQERCKQQAETLIQHGIKRVDSLYQLLNEVISDKNLPEKQSDNGIGQIKVNGELTEPSKQETQSVILRKQWQGNFNNYLLKQLDQVKRENTSLKQQNQILKAQVASLLKQNQGLKIIRIY